MKPRITVMFWISLLFYSSVFSQALSLDQCVDIAIEHNKTLKQGQITVNQSVISTKQTYSNLYPSISLSTSENSQNTNISGNNWDSRSNLSAGVRQNIYTPGLYSDLKLAQINEKTSHLTQVNLSAQIRSTVKITYYNILTSMELLNVYRENIHSAEQDLDRIRQMYKLGIRTKSDVLKAEVQKGDFESSLLSEETNLASLKRQLNLLMGNSSSTDLTLTTIDANSISIPTIEIAKSALLKNNPGYLAMQQNRKANLMNLKIAREAYLPTVSASYSYSKAENYIGGDIVGSNSIGISASIGLFDSFQKKQIIQKSKLNVKRAEIQLDENAQGLLSELQGYYTDIDYYNRIIELQAKNLESAQKDYELVSKQYEMGLGIILDQTNAQLSVLKSQSNLVKAKYSRKIIESQILRLLNTD